MKLRPTMQEVFMNMAKELAKRSTCNEKSVGCVVTSPDFEQVYSMGYNGNYAGGPNNCDGLGHKCGCIHAEVNALIKCPTKDRNKVVFITLSPCLDCAKLIINVGASAVYFGECWKDNPGARLLEANGIPCYIMMGTVSDPIRFGRD